jgi:hypothetical protein
VTSYLDAREIPPFWYQVDEGDADAASLNGTPCPKLEPNIYS